MDEEKRDLAKDMKDEEIKKSKTILLELKRSKVILPVKIMEKQVKDEEGKETNKIQYAVYIPFKRENGKVEPIQIATVDEEGNFIKNMALLNDEQFTNGEIEDLGNILNNFGLENDKVDINELKENLKEMEERPKQKEETNKDDIENDKNEEEKEDKEEKDLAEIEKEGEEKAIAKRKHINPNNICKIRRDSQFYKNYKHIPKTAYFYLDGNDRLKAEYIDKDGSIKELEGCSEIKDRTTMVTRMGTDGENIKEERPYRVMDAKGLKDVNKNTQDIRIAIFKDSYGYLRIETIHQGRNGEWEGKNIDIYGKERNSTEMNRLIDERYKNPKTGVIAKRHDELIKSGYSSDGIQLDELSKKRKIEEYINEGYTEEEANDIYNYVVGELQLTEDNAKLKVNEEIIEKLDEESTENDGGRTPGGDAWGRRHG